MLFLLSLFLSVVAVFCEPQCSPFHYHEQLLEKMVDIKHKVDLFTKQMDTWENRISEKFKQIDEKLNEKQRMETEITGKVNAMRLYLNDTLGKIEGIVGDGVKTPVVYFKARDVVEKSPKADQIVVFKTIVRNEGSGYNEDTGIFTVPVSGTYLFTTQFCLYANKELAVRIVASSNVITVANFGDKDWGNICTSTDGVANLNQGEEVKVQVAYSYSGTVIYNDKETRYWSYFSGVLLHI